MGSEEMFSNVILNEVLINAAYNIVNCLVVISKISCDILVHTDTNVLWGIIAYEILSIFS